MKTRFNTRIFSISGDTARVHVDTEQQATEGVGIGAVTLVVSLDGGKPRFYVGQEVVVDIEIKE